MSAKALENPPLWVELFYGGQLRACFASPAEAVNCARHFGAHFCIVVDPQMREQWLNDAEAAGLPEDFIPHPTQQEVALATLMRRCEMLHHVTEEGRIVIHDALVPLLNAVPAHLTPEVVCSLKPAESAKKGGLAHA